MVIRGASWGQGFTTEGSWTRRPGLRRWKDRWKLRGQLESGVVLTRSPGRKSHARWCWATACPGTFRELSWVLLEPQPWSLTQATAGWTAVPVEEGGQGLSLSRLGVCPPTQLWLGLRKQPCFLHFKGFFIGHPVHFPGALAGGRGHRQATLGRE